MANKMADLESILAIYKNGDREDVTAKFSELARQNSALAGGVADLKANPEIARIVESHTAGGRVDYAAALLEVVRILDRQNDALARQIDDVAVEGDLTTACLVGAEHGRDVVVAIRARLEALAEHYEARSLAYDAQAAVARPDEIMPTKKAWRWQADLAFEVAEAISRVVGSPRNGHQAAGNGPCVDFTGAGGIKTRVSEKSQPAADLGRSTRCAENGQAAVAVGDGPVAAVGAAGGAEHG